jgi:hypothetical protein
MGDQNQYQQNHHTTSNQVVYRENPRPKRLRPLTQFEEDIARRRRALVYTYMPELIPTIEEMVKNGLIDGWRNVCFVRVYATGEVV